MDRMWRTPERNRDDEDFFTDIYQTAEWLVDRRARNLQEQKFFDRLESVELTPSEVEEAGIFLETNKVPVKRPDAIDIKLQGRNPRIYRDSPGGAVDVILRTGNEATIYAFVHGYERDPVPEGNERSLTIIKAMWKLTNWHFATESGINNPRNWHDERFELHKIYKAEGEKILALINLLS